MRERRYKESMRVRERAKRMRERAKHEGERESYMHICMREAGLSMVAKEGLACKRWPITRES